MDEKIELKPVTDGGRIIACVGEGIETKPMVYSTDREREVLFSGKFRNVPFYIISLGSHPVAYVDLKDFENADLDMLEKAIETHCGITYNEDYLYISEDKEIEGKFLGWDYAHFGDYYTSPVSFEFDNKGKRWTTEEIFGDVVNVVDQIYEFIGVDENEPR